MDFAQKISPDRIFIKGVAYAVRPLTMKRLDQWLLIMKRMDAEDPRDVARSMLKVIKLALPRKARGPLRKLSVSELQKIFTKINNAWRIELKKLGQHSLE